MLRFFLGRWVVSCAFVLVLSGSSGCSPSGPPDSARLGVPDRVHGPSTDVDIDGDGHTNDSDNCPSLANADQRPACDYPFPPPAPSGTDVVADVIARINFWREILGLEPVVEDAALSASCAAHANYMAETSPSPAMPNLTREEDPASEHYTPEGAEAGEVALMSISSFPVDDITRFLDLVFHRWPLIHPGLRRIGVAYDRRFLVVRADAVDAAPEGAHAVLWPPPDSAYASAQFPGGETPCMNWVDPTDGEMCLPSALMPSVLVPGNAISAVTGSMRRVDTGAEIPLQRVYFDGGETDLEKSTLFQGAILLATPEGSVAPPTEYEVRVDATVDGAPETWRWRFRAGPGINQEIACDVFRRANFSFERAVEVTESGFGAKLCDMPMFYQLQTAGSFRVTLDYDPRFGDLELHAYDPSRAEVGAPEENDGHEVIEGVPGLGYFEVRGREGATGAYVILVEAI